MTRKSDDEYVRLFIRKEQKTRLKIAAADADKPMIDYFDDLLKNARVNANEDDKNKPDIFKKINKNWSKLI